MQSSHYHWHCSPDLLAFAQLSWWVGWHRAAHLKTLWVWGFCLFFPPFFFCPGLSFGAHPTATHRACTFTQPEHGTSPGSAAINRKHSFWQCEENPVFFTLEILHMLFCLGHCSAFMHKCLMTFFKKNKEIVMQKSLH